MPPFPAIGQPCPPEVGSSKLNSVTVAGLQVGILLGGTVVVEEVFTLPGIGRLVLWSIYQRDYPLTQSTILFIAVMFMTINLAVDMLYGVLDPRIRYSA